MMAMSAAVAMIIHLLGRDFPEVSSLPNAVEDRLTAEDEGDCGKRLEPTGTESERVFADQKRPGAKRQEAKTHRGPSLCQPANLPDAGHLRRAHVVGRHRHAEKVASDHDDHHEHRSEDRVSSDNETKSDEEHVGDLLGKGIEGVGEDALVGETPFLHGGDDAAKPGGGKDDAGG